MKCQEIGCWPDSPPYAMDAGMPELPEIETARSRLQKAAMGKKIVKVVVDEDDYVCYDQAEPAEVANALRGAVVTGTGRKGKYFWMKLDRKPWLLLHLGMTGNVEIRRRAAKGKTKTEFGWGGRTLWGLRATVGKEAPEGVGALPRFCRLFLVMDDATEIAITDPRRFGRIRLCEDPETVPAIERLGFDPLHDFPSAKTLGAVLLRRRRAIKAVLLDQGIFAGVGNWIADEILYQARLDPHRLASELSAAEVTRLRRTLLAIIKNSVSVAADYDRYPKNWLFHYRWGKTKNAQDSRGRAIMHETIGGRTTAWVPDLQS